MNKLINFSILILLITNTACSQSNTIKAQYSEIDFFRDQNKLFYWVGPFSGARNIDKQIRYMPLMSYDDLAIGQCRIISYPKAGLATWEANIKTIRDMTQQDQEVRKIALDQQIQKEYDIYAFFIEAKNLKPVPDPVNPNAREPNFPCPVYVYKKDFDKWELLKKTDVKNYSGYADLEFDTVVGDKK